MRIAEFDPGAAEWRCLNGHVVRLPLPLEVRARERQEARERRMVRRAAEASFR